MRRVNQPARTYIGIPSKLLSSMSRNASSIADFPEVGFGEIIR
jgi:hypothetical protein